MAQNKITLNLSEANDGKLLQTFQETFSTNKQTQNRSLKFGYVKLKKGAPLGKISCLCPRKTFVEMWPAEIGRASCRERV